MNRSPVKIRVIYADTDAMGIIYHTNYIEKREKRIAEGYTVHACTDRDGKIIRIPAVIVEKTRLFYPNFKGD